MSSSVGNWSQYSDERVREWLAKPGVQRGGEAYATVTQILSDITGLSPSQAGSLISQLARRDVFLYAPIEMAVLHRQERVLRAIADGVDGDANTVAHTVMEMATQVLPSWR